MQLSFLVHPDKNPDDKDRVQKAFEGEYIASTRRKNTALGFGLSNKLKSFEIWRQLSSLFMYSGFMLLHEVLEKPWNSI